MATDLCLKKDAPRAWDFPGVTWANPILSGTGL